MKSADTGPRQIKLTLVNTRSIYNKYFILNDFFTSQVLDFISVTETWLKAGELDSLADTPPVDCDFFNKLRLVEILQSVFTNVLNVELNLPFIRSLLDI